MDPAGPTDANSTCHIRCNDIAAPNHMAFRDAADLPRIGVAVVRAYLPDATPRQLMAASFAKHGSPASAA